MTAGDPVAGQWGDEEIMAAIRAQARLVAREEIARQSGLVLRRLSDLDPGVVDRSELASIFGEALRDFGGTTDEPGPKAAA